MFKFIFIFFRLFWSKKRGQFNDQKIHGLTKHSMCCLYPNEMKWKKILFFIKHLYQPTFRDHSIPPLHSVSVVCCTAYQVDPPSWPCVAISTKQPHASISSSASISPSVTACLFIQLELFGDPRTPPDVCQCLRGAGGHTSIQSLLFFFHQILSP